MALSGLEIYKRLPKTNCKKCGFATCLAFAMQLAAKKVSLDKCPTVSEEAKQLLDSAAQPPVKLVTIGTGESRLEIGNETVMFRHEQKFFHPCGIGFQIEDTTAAAALDKKMAAIIALSFERIGQMIAPDFVCVKNSSGSSGTFVKVVETVAGKAGNLKLLLWSESAEPLRAALGVCKDRRPLIVGAKKDTVSAFAALAKEFNVPMSITASSLDEAAELTQKAKSAGVEEIVLDLKRTSLTDTIEENTLARRMALKKNHRSLGYPLMTITEKTEKYQELAEAVSHIAKYSSIVVVKNTESDFVLPLLVARQDIYTDPQKPVQVEAKVYEVGKVTKDSPVVITTNFSITYFTVLGEVESSKVPSFIIPCDTEGMSVLTAWAAEKFTSESIDAALKKFNVASLISHKHIVIPGYVAVLSGKIEEDSGWKVSVGPKEASGLPNYLKSWKSN